VMSNEHSDVTVNRSMEWKGLWKTRQSMRPRDGLPDLVLSAATPYQITIN
jgi:hypothetical protein